MIVTPFLFSMPTPRFDTRWPITRMRRPVATLPVDALLMKNVGALLLIHRPEHREPERCHALEQETLPNYHCSSLSNALPPRSDKRHRGIHAVHFAPLTHGAIIMRKLAHLLLACTTVLQCPVFAAPPGLTSQQMYEMEGVYALTDGRIVRLTVIDDRLYVDLNQRNRLTLVAVSEHVFVTRQNEVTVERRSGGNGEVMMRFDPNSRIAKVHTVPAKDRPVL